MFISWSLITCILCSTLGEPLSFFFHPFSRIPNINLCSDNPTSYGKIFTTTQTLIKWLAVQSHRHFNLTCQQETDCFISGFSLFLGSWGRVTELQFIVTRFFGEQSPGDADLFAILDKVSHNAIMASRRFDFHIYCVSPIQSKHLCAFDRYMDYFGSSRSFFQFTSVAFQKVSTQNRDFRVFFGRFFKNFVRHEKSCFSVTLPRFSGVLTCLIVSFHFALSVMSYDQGCRSVSSCFRVIHFIWNRNEFIIKIDRLGILSVSLLYFLSPCLVTSTDQGFRSVSSCFVTNETNKTDH